MEGKIYFIIIFSLVVVALVREFQRGHIYTPFFILSSAYLLLITIGAFFFELIRGVHSLDLLLPWVSIGYLSLLLGMLASKLRFSPLLKGRPDSDISPLKLSISKHSPIKSKELLMGVFLLCSLMSIFFFLRSGVPILANDVNEAKINAMSGGGYIRIFVVALPIICLFYWFDYLCYPSRQRFVIFLAATVYTMLFTVGTGFRTSVVVLAGQLFIVYVLLKKPRLSVWLLVFGASAFFAFVAFFGAYRRGDFSLTSSLQEAAIILTARAQTLDLVMNKWTDFRWGATFFSDMLKLLPGEQTGFNVELKYAVFKNAAMMPDNAGINPSILGEMYANFAYGGMILGMFVFGFAVGKLYHFTMHRFTRESVVAYSIFITSMAVAIKDGIGNRVVPLMLSLGWIAIFSLISRHKLVLRRECDEV